MKKSNLTAILSVTIITFFLITGSAFGDDALYVDPNGNVGIGTEDTGSAKLKVNGLTRIDGSLTVFSDSQSYFSLKDNYQAYLYIQPVYVDDTNSYVKLGVYDYTGTGGHRNLVIPGDSGNVGIGTSSPGYRLTVNGSAAKPGGGSWSDSSDIRIKKDVKNLTNATDIIADYPKPIIYKWINPEEHENTTREVIGLSAQDLEAINPEMVVESDDTSKDGELTGGKTKAIFYSNEFFALQLGAVQELIERVETLEAELCKMDDSYEFCKE